MDVERRISLRTVTQLDHHLSEPKAAKWAVYSGRRRNDPSKTLAWRYSDAVLCRGRVRLGKRKKDGEDPDMHDDGRGVKRVEYMNMDMETGIGYMKEWEEA